MTQSPTQLPIDWEGMARDAALNTIFPGYQFFMALKDVYSSYFPSDDQYKDNYFDTYLPEENGFNADQRAGQFDGFLNRINPLDSLVSIPDIGMNHGHQDAYDTGKAQGEFAGTVAITVASFASGVFSCGTLGNTAMALYEFASVAGDLKAAHDSFQKGDVAGGAMNLLSAGLNILSLRNTMSQCFTGSTQFVTPNGLKRVRDFQDQDQLDTRTELDPNAPITVGWVSKVFVGWAQIFELEVNGRLIETTAEHCFQLKNEGWVPANELQPGDLIASDNPEVWLPVQRAELTTRFDTVYNVRVANDHTYFVGGEDWGFSVWAHNTYAGTGPRTDNRYGHNRTIRETARDVTAKGDRVLSGGRSFDGVYRKEAVFKTPGGFKSSRRPDLLVQRPDGSIYGINVGRTQANGQAVLRERLAIQDLNEIWNLEMKFVSYGGRR